MRNKSPFSFVIATAVATALGLSSTFAQSVVTEPVGFTTIKVKGGGTTSSPVTTFAGLSLARPTVYQATVPSGTGLGASLVNNFTVLTFAANSFTANQFSPASGDPTHYLEITNGGGAGALIPITATTTNSITLGENVQGIVNGTTTFRIRPHWTFGAAFGPTNSAGFAAGTTASTTDADIIETVQANVVTSYFYNGTLGHWANTATPSVNANNTPIDPDAGLQIRRKGSAELAFKINGDVKLGPTGLFIAGGSTDTTTVVPNPYPTESHLLKDLNLIGSGLVGGSASNADIVRIHDFARGQFNDFYFNNSTSRWTTGTTDASAFVIPPGAGISIIRKANRTPASFTWYAPQPAYVLGDTPLPLTLVSAASRKTHGAFGVADVNLPLSGPSGVESRNSVSGLHTIIVNFSNPILAATAQLTGIGSVSSTVISGKSVQVSLSGISDAQAATVTLTNITDTASQNLSSVSVPVKFLSGDTNLSSSATGADVTAVKANAAAGGNLSLSNFRADLNNSGGVTGADVTIAKARAALGASLP